MENTVHYKDSSYSYRERDSPGSAKSPLLLPKKEQPREKLIDSGAAALSDLELISIILGKGTSGKNVMILAGEILDSLDEIKKTPSIKELCKIKGIGEAKACAIAAMLDFGRRKWASGHRISTPMDIFDHLRHFADRKQERFICISLNGAHEVINTRVVTIGLVNRTIVHPREVFSDALIDRASAVIVAHNHPSGEIFPSEEDNEVTKRLKESSVTLGIQLLDHLIFTSSQWYSYSHAGVI